MFPGDVRIMIFYGCSENVILTHSTKFITVTLLKYTFSEPPGNKNNQVYPSLFHISWRDIILITSQSDECIVTSLECPQEVNFKHNAKHITVVLFSILHTKFVS